MDNELVSHVVVVLDGHDILSGQPPWLDDTFESSEKSEKKKKRPEK